jgi:hypothetical protein
MSVNATVLSSEQRSYLINRVNEIVSTKVRAKAVELYGPAGRPESPTWGAVFAAIRAGEITLKEGTENNTNAYLNPSDVVWPAMEAKKKELADYKEMLSVEKQRLLDSIWLDKATATALAEFEAL